MKYPYYPPNGIWQPFLMSKFTFHFFSKMAANHYRRNSLFLAFRAISDQKGTFNFVSRPTAKGANGTV
jgi:hypothetical protein